MVHYAAAGRLQGLLMRPNIEPAGAGRRAARGERAGISPSCGVAARRAGLRVVTLRDRGCNHQAHGALSSGMRTLEIVHRTRYEYSTPVDPGRAPPDVPAARQPRPAAAAHRADDRAAAAVRWIHDAFGNSIAIASLRGARPMVAGARTARSGLEHFAAAARAARRSRSTPARCRSAISPRRRLTWRAMSSGTIPIRNAIVSGWTKQFLEGRGRRGDLRRARRACARASRKPDVRHAFRGSARNHPPSPWRPAAAPAATTRLLMMEGARGARSRGALRRRATSTIRRSMLRRATRPALRYPHAWMEVYLPGRRLGRVRPDQRHNRHRAADPRRRRSRPRAGHADQGRVHRGPPTSP